MQLDRRVSGIAMTTAAPVRMVWSAIKWWDGAGPPGDSEENVENAKENAKEKEGTMPKAFVRAQPLSCTGCRQEDNTDTDEENVEKEKKN